MIAQTTEPEMVFELRDQRGPLDSPWGVQMNDVESRVAEGESTAIAARWESGRLLLRRRKGKQFPNGLLESVAKELGVTPRELQYRARFAEVCDTEEKVRNAVSDFGSWRQIIRNVLPKSGKREPLSEEQKHVRSFRRFLTRGHKEMDAFDASILADEDCEALAELARRINRYLESM